jgi:hypothetical protein
MASPSFRIFLAYLKFFCCLLFLFVVNAFGQELSVPTPSPQAIGFTADFTSRVIFKDREHTAMSGKIYLLPPRVRFELLSEEEDVIYQEVQLYDFEHLKMRRVFQNDKIFFQIELTEKNRVKAMQEGWIPWKDFPNTKRRKIKLKEDLVNDHPCILYLQERKIEIPGGSKPPAHFFEYSLVWEASDLKDLPVRIIYFLTNQRTVVVDYNNARLVDPEPTLFQPPEGFVDLSPF